MNAGRFREDLYYYRLQGVAINIPPLHEGGEDIFVLAQFLPQIFNKVHGSQFHVISPAVENVFLRYTWPGNVRELGKLLERICILEPGSIVELQHLPNRIIRAC